jgi:hypothetical protein
MLVPVLINTEAMIMKFIGKPTRAGTTKLLCKRKRPAKMLKRAEKKTPKILILVKFVASSRVSPVKPDAKSLTIGPLNCRTRTTITDESKSRALLRLLVNSLASEDPLSLRIRLYMGKNAVAIPALIKEKITYGIVLDIR